ISGVPCDPALDAFAIFNAVVGVLERESHGQIFFQFACISEAAEKLSGGVAEELGGAEGAEGVGVSAAENVSGCCAGSNPGSLVAVGHHGFCFAEGGGVSANYGGDFIGGHGAFDEAGGFGLVGAVVIEDFFHGEFF